MVSFGVHATKGRKMTSPTNPGQPSNPGNNVSSPPTSVEVSRIHTNSDLDSGVNCQHHTLGILHNQAAGGDHKHDGHASKLIGKSLDLSFPTVASATYSQAQIQSIINGLRKLGFGV